MSASAEDLIQARQIIGELLETIELEAYLFEIEPKAGEWELKVECAVEEGWGSFSLMLAEHLPQNRSEREALIKRCREALAACKRERRD